MKPRRPTIKDSTQRLGTAGAKRKSRLVAAKAARKAAAKKAKLTKNQAALVFRPGDNVILAKVPAGFVDDLPLEDQRAIERMVGKAVSFVAYSDDGRAELEFVDDAGTTHFIYMHPSYIEASK
jgi:hypothetical protein